MASRFGELLLILVFRSRGFAKCWGDLLEKKSAPPNEPISMQPLDELGIEAAREYAQLDRYQQWDRQAGRRVRTASDHLRIVKGNF